jgi:hypothetical protein
MRLRRIIVVASLTGLGLLVAGPAFSQNNGNNNTQVPNIPGLGQLGKAVQDGINGLAGALGQAANPTANNNGTGALNLPGSQSMNPLPVASTAPRPARAAAPARPRARRSLPRTGAPVSGLALLGIAMLSGGRLLLELTRPARAAS